MMLRWPYQGGAPQSGVRFASSVVDRCRTRKGTRAHFLVALALILGCLITFRTAPALGQTLFGITSFGADLVTIDTASGAATVVGNTGLQLPCALAYDSQRNLLLVVECFGGGAGNNLFVVDPTTAATSPAPFSTTWAFGQALAYRIVDDALYATQFFTREIARIDPATGAVTVVGEIGQPGELINIGGLAVRPSDASLFAGGDRVATDLLFEISTSPGTSPLETEVGPTNRLMSSLAFHPNGTLYAADGEFLLTVDPATGATTEVGAFGDGIGFVAGLTFVSPPVSGPVDVWIKDCELDIGDVPSTPTPCDRFFVSPDIWIDNDNDMIIDEPVEGVGNTLRALVRNRETGTAQDVQVDFYYRDNTTGLVFPNGATLIGSDTVTVPPNGIAVASTNWVVPSPPSSGGHWCIGVVLNHPDDPAIDPVVPPYEDNNVGIANIWFIAGRAGQQMLLNFLVGSGPSGFGLTPWPRDFIIQVDNQLPVGWTWALEGVPVDQPFVLKLGEERRADLSINVPSEAAPRAGGSIAVRQVDVATGRLVGGVRFDLYEDHLPPQAVRTLGASIVDGQVLLNWQPVFKEAETGFRERVAYYELSRDGTPLQKVVRDSDPRLPGYQWLDTGAVPGKSTYTIQVVDEGGNASPVEMITVEVPGEQELFNWLTWLLMLLLLLLLTLLFVVLRRLSSQ